MNKNNKPIVQMKNIGKMFGPVRVLEGVNFDIYPGEVHVLAGENGAGKSTLIKILAGVHTSYEGEIFFEGRQISPASPIDANNIGISVIYQELSLVPTMDVVDNLFLGRTETKAGFVLRKVQEKKAKKILDDLGLEVRAKSLIRDLQMSMRQLIEIAKAVSLDAKVIVMDEPSSALNAHDAEQLFSLIERMKRSGMGVVYISHRMEEIDRLADRITVLRDGKWIKTAPADEITNHELINLMVGRKLSDQIQRKFANHRDDYKFSVENANIYDQSGSRKKLVDNVSFSVKAGEVLGIAGLRGSGASELLNGLFGSFNKQVAERLILNGEEISIRNPREAIRKKVALLTNNRKATGLILPMSIIDNTCLPSLPRLCRHGWRNEKGELKAASDQDGTLNFHTQSLHTKVEYLSGGNQQKVTISKWLEIDPEVLLLDEPTRGVDVGAKHDIYNLIDDLSKQGITIILITSEMPELLALSDRIIVMHRGTITAEFTKDEANAENVLQAAMGEKELV
jgi:ABC-type sugar transport system ATPase subunit